MRTREENLKVANGYYELARNCKDNPVSLYQKSKKYYDMIPFSELDDKDLFRLSIILQELANLQVLSLESESRFTKDFTKVICLYKEAINMLYHIKEGRNAEWYEALVTSLYKLSTIYKEMGSIKEARNCLYDILAVEEIPYDFICEAFKILIAIAPPVSDLETEVNFFGLKVFSKFNESSKKITLLADKFFIFKDAISNTTNITGTPTFKSFQAILRLVIKYSKDESFPNQNIKFLMQEKGFIDKLTEMLSALQAFPSVSMTLFDTVAGSPNFDAALVRKICTLEEKVKEGEGVIKMLEMKIKQLSSQPSKKESRLFSPSTIAVDEASTRAAMKNA